VRSVPIVLARGPVFTTCTTRTFLAALATESEPSRKFAKTFPSSIFVASFVALTLSPITKAGNPVPHPYSSLIVDGCGASNTVTEIKTTPFFCIGIYLGVSEVRPLDEEILPIIGSDFALAMMTLSFTPDGTS